MTRFELRLDPSQSAHLISHLREDASLLPHAPSGPLPAAGPVARFGRALEHAFGQYNSISSAVADRALRHAEDMTIFTHDALAQDDSFGADLRGITA